MKIRSNTLVGGKMNSNHNLIENSDSEDAGSNTNSGYFNTSTYNRFEQIKEK